MTLRFDDENINAHRNIEIDRVSRYVEISVGNNIRDEFVNLSAVQARNLGLALILLAAEIEAKP